MALSAKTWVGIGAGTALAVAVIFGVTQCSGRSAEQEEKDKIALERDSVANKLDSITVAGNRILEYARDLERENGLKTDTINCLRDSVRVLNDSIVVLNDQLVDCRNGNKPAQPAQPTQPAKPAPRKKNTCPQQPRRPVETAPVVVVTEPVVTTAPVVTNPAPQINNGSAGMNVGGNVQNTGTIIVNNGGTINSGTAAQQPAPCASAVVVVRQTRTYTR